MAENEKKGTPTEEELQDEEDYAADRALKAEIGELSSPTGQSIPTTTNRGAQR